MSKFSPYAPHIPRARPCGDGRAWPLGEGASQPDPVPSPYPTQRGGAPKSRRAGQLGWGTSCLCSEVRAPRSAEAAWALLGPLVVFCGVSAFRNSEKIEDKQVVLSDRSLSPPRTVPMGGEPISI